MGDFMLWRADKPIAQAWQEVNQLMRNFDPAMNARQRWKGFWTGYRMFKRVDPKPLVWACMAVYKKPPESAELRRRLFGSD